jgi:hypothetical protein
MGPACNWLKQFLYFEQGSVLHFEVDFSEVTIWTPPTRVIGTTMEAQPGSSGFLGGYIVNELLGRGHEVIRIENFSKYGKATLPIELLSLKRGSRGGTASR